MVAIPLGPFFEVEVDIQRWNTIVVTAAVHVPSVIPGVGGLYPLGTETLSPDRLEWSPDLKVMPLGTGFEAGFQLKLDLDLGAILVEAKLDVRVSNVSVAHFPVEVSKTWQYPWPQPPVRTIGSGRIAHVVVVALENRSFDNLLGWLYEHENNTPPRNIPPQEAPTFDGLKTGQYWCPANAADVNQPDAQVPESRRVYATKGASSKTVPNPDPFEQFKHMNYQIFGTEAPDQGQPATMKGFVVDYAQAISSAGETGESAAIMQTYAPEQIPVLTALARSYAVCDRWFASTPCQTWPNRAFLHAGTSCGRVNNLDSDTDSNRPPDPKYYGTKTIFNVMEELDVTWKVYGDSPLPTLARYQFATELWNPLLTGHFKSFVDFQTEARAGQLPSYAFLEPDFMITRNDGHPPHDVTAGDRFLYDVWEAVSTGPAWENTLLIITFDEHGGCYDHVSPPWTAVKPDGSSPQQPFEFDRYGVRVPAVVVSPWIESGTVFRSGSEAVEYDHTSILATLRDWQGLHSRAALKGGWLESKRIIAAPTLAPVLTRTAVRTDTPAIAKPDLQWAAPLDTPLNDMQRAVAAAAIAAAAPRGGSSGPAAADSASLYTPAMHEAVASEVVQLKTVADAWRRVGKPMAAAAKAAAM